MKRGEKGRRRQTRIPSLTPKNGGLLWPPALGLFLAALDSGAWKLNFFTVWIRGPGGDGGGEYFTIQIK